MLLRCSAVVFAFEIVLIRMMPEAKNCRCAPVYLAKVVLLGLVYNRTFSDMSCNSSRALTDLNPGGGSSFCLGGKFFFIGFSGQNYGKARDCRFRLA